MEREFEEKYGISNIVDFVLSVTRVEDKDVQKTSHYTCRSGCGFCIQVLNFLLIVKFLGTLSYQISILLIWFIIKLVLSNTLYGIYRISFNDNYVFNGLLIKFNVYKEL